MGAILQKVDGSTAVFDTRGQVPTCHTFSSYGAYTGSITNKKQYMDITKARDWQRSLYMALYAHGNPL